MVGPQLEYSIDEVRTSTYEGMTGYEIIRDSQNMQIKPNGKIFYGGFNVIDEENGSFTLIDQDYAEAWSIEAKSIRSLKLKLNKTNLESKNTHPIILRGEFKRAHVVSRSKWNEELAKRDQAIKDQEARS